MKSVRHAMIKNIIEREEIETQEELAAALREHKIKVTQATVSRDIKEMMLIKVPVGDGRYRYASPLQESVLFSRERISRLFRDSVTSIDASENIIVVKTLPGGAKTVASAIDYAKWPEVIGTVAGDDNIIVVVKPKEATPDIVAKLKDLSTL